MTQAKPSRAPRPASILVGLAAFAIVAAVLYGKTPEGDKDASLRCAASNTALKRVAPLEKGAVAAAASSSTAKPMAALEFLAPGGAKTSLDAFSGKVVLLNLWATWCVPCREEMPTLDKLQGQLGSKDFEVVAVNIDTARLERAPEFLRQIGVSHLAFYSDPKADVFYRLKTAGKVTGLPTSILIGRDGCEIATMAGPADWASGDAVAMIKAAF